MTTPLALVIEDDEDLAEIFSLALQSANFETEVVRDGQLALTRLAEIAPALVMLDLNLPHLSGAEILRHIRADQRLDKTKVILATAQDRLAEELRAQANLTLLKPISPEQLRLLASRLYPPQNH
jgi:two-component system, OmpR family, phosphate regulon response regulator PhoB